MSILENVAHLLENEEIPFMKKVHSLVFSQRGVIVYAGAASDIEHAVLLGSNLVFFDTHLPKENVSEIIRKVGGFGAVEDVKTEKSEEAWKTIVEFRIENINFRLVYYAEDATNIGLKWFPELENGIHAYFVKVPFPKEQKAGSLREPKFFSRVLGMIKLRGFYLERECPISFQIPAEKLGFEKVVSGYISALSVHDAKGNLYRKVKEIENLEKLVLLDWMMASDKI